MTSELDKAAEGWWKKKCDAAFCEYIATGSPLAAEDVLTDRHADFKAGHARGVADERERAEGLVRALRHSLSWGESMYGRLVAGHKDDINWTAIEEARRTLAEYEAGK